MDIEIGKITVNVEIVGRVDGLDFVTIQSYADDMEAGAVFPPVELVGDGDVFWLVDGLHRLEAAKKINREQISSNVTEGDERVAMLRSCAANAEHGKRRTNEDKHQKVMMMLEDEEWSKCSGREIARRCRVDNKFVEKLRKNLTEDILSEETERTYITKHGTQAVMNTTNIGGNDDGKLVQTEIEPIISAEAAYEEKIKLERKQRKSQFIMEKLGKTTAKEFWREYQSLLINAAIIEKRMKANCRRFDIYSDVAYDEFLRGGISKYAARITDFLEEVRDVSFLEEVPEEERREMIREEKIMNEESLEEE